MGIFGAMTTAISGMQAQSFALERISDNIANSQTTAYKRSDVSFADYVPDSPARQQALGVVAAFSRPTNTIQGDIAISSVPTHMAVNGDGYFVVASVANTVDGRPVFEGESYYTRRGDFEIDANGYLVNQTGYYLKGIGIDPVTGNPMGSLPEVIQLSNDFSAAAATTQIDYRANLALNPLTTASDPGDPGSELIDPSLYAVDPTVGGAGVVQANDESLFLTQSLSGGAITVYDSAGSPISVQFRWAKTDSVASGGTDVWNMYYQTDANATGAAPAWRNIGQDFSFGANGQLSPALVGALVDDLTVNGVNLGDIDLNFGANGITQFDDPNGVVKVTGVGQDGFAAGEIVGVGVSDTGRIVASYTNGRSVDLAQVTLASFNGDAGLARTDGGAMRATAQSGAPVIGAQGVVVGGALEASNTDIADEFTKLIVTQQAYAANTRVITTATELLQESLNIIR
jgi:flagellar hook protein FlgE